MNVTISEDGTKMTIEIDLTKPGSLSASGKNKVLASTRGNKTYTTPQGRDVIVGLNVYVPAR